MTDPVIVWTQEHIDALQASIASGVLSVTFSNRSTTFQSLEQMRALLADMVRQVNPGTRSYRLAATSKGV